mmetsp:Transcript_11013/g.28251  ORF Transcript_11013/g.28251 Transcript_11013/m.28251 type:complete len:219 (+) Transcript_11013:454-1110(+)
MFTSLPMEMKSSTASASPYLAASSRFSISGSAGGAIGWAAAAAPGPTGPNFFPSAVMNSWSFISSITPCMPFFSASAKRSLNCGSSFSACIFSIMPPLCICCAICCICCIIAGFFIASSICLILSACSGSFIASSYAFCICASCSGDGWGAARALTTLREDGVERSGAADRARAVAGVAGRAAARHAAVVKDAMIGARKNRMSGDRRIRASWIYRRGR